jgi:hypothetical protein
MAQAAISKPRPKLILFCLEYSIVDEMLVDITAIRLVLAACVGGTFKNVRAGTIIIPPPTPSIEPKVPAPSPTTSKNVSIAILSNKVSRIPWNVQKLVG